MIALLAGTASQKLERIQPAWKGLIKKIIMQTSPFNKPSVFEFLKLSRRNHKLEEKAGK